MPPITAATSTSPNAAILMYLCYKQLNNSQLSELSILRESDTLYVAYSCAGYLMRCNRLVRCGSTVLTQTYILENGMRRADRSLRAQVAVTMRALSP